MKQKRIIEFINSFFDVCHTHKHLVDASCCGIVTPCFFVMNCTHFVVYKANTQRTLAHTEMTDSLKRRELKTA